MLRRRQQCGGLAPRIGALHRNHRHVLALDHRHVEIDGMLGNPRQVLVTRSGVHDHAIPRVGHEIDDQIVDHAAAGQQHAGIQRLADSFEAAHVVRQEEPQEFPDTSAGQVHDGHVRHIEYAGIAAHRVVLFDLRTIVQRHVPAAEVDDFCAMLDMCVVKRSLKAHRNLAANEYRDAQAPSCSSPSVLKT